MKVVYLIQTHKNPEQIYRLVQTIKKSSPGSYVLVSHDFTACNLDATPLRSLPDVEVINGKGGRADFSIIQGYLDAVDWLFSHNTEFDWLINITGQDYPTQPLPSIEKFLAETKYDGFLKYFDILSDSEDNPWGVEQGRGRYLYQYWHSGIYISGRSLQEKIFRRLLVILHLAINNSQPFIRFCGVFDSVMIGVLATLTPFNEKFMCYGDSYFHTLSRKCIQYLHDFSKQNNGLVKYYKKTCISDESFIQTVLVNSDLFNLCNEYKRYIDFSNSQDSSRPRTLTVEDYSRIVQDEIHFARKFDLAQDSKILDMLDARILQAG